MLHQIAAHAVACGDHADAEFCKFVGRPDAAAHQKRRAVNGARANDHSLRAQRITRAVVKSDVGARRMAAVKPHSLDERIGATVKFARARTAASR